MIEWSADCNGDGIVDYGQILDGTLTDADRNGIPDVCQIESLGACRIGNGICEFVESPDCDGFYFYRQTYADVECFDKVTVDPNAEGDDPANGIFSTIQRAIDASYDGMTISVMAWDVHRHRRQRHHAARARHHHPRHRRGGEHDHRRPGRTTRPARRRLQRHRHGDRGTDLPERLRRQQRRCVPATATLRSQQCTILENSAVTHGGINVLSATSTLIDCLI